MNLLELFVHVDDLCQTFTLPTAKNAVPHTRKTRSRRLSMHQSEIMTLLIHSHQAHDRNFKAFYGHHVKQRLQAEFPSALSYQRFVAWMPRSILPLTAYLFSQLGLCSGLSFADSTPISVCHTRRAKANKVFAGRAAHS